MAMVAVVASTHVDVQNAAPSSTTCTLVRCGHSRAAALQAGHYYSMGGVYRCGAV
jgi:hypothetical protein